MMIDPSLLRRSMFHKDKDEKNYPDININLKLRGLK